MSLGVKEGDVLNRYSKIFPLMRRGSNLILLTFPLKCIIQDSNNLRGDMLDLEAVFSTRG